MAGSDAHVFDAAFRLLSMLGENDQLAYMVKHLKREIIFYALCGTCGKQFLQSMTGIQQAGEIYEATSVIRGSLVWIAIRDAPSAAATSFVAHCVTAAVYAFPGTRVTLRTRASPYRR